MTSTLPDTGGPSAHTTSQAHTQDEDSQSDRTWWERSAIAAILVLGLASYTWGIQRGSLTAYYAGAVRSMSSSWSAFFLGSVDPAGWLTIDKLPGAFWIQALAARIFGYSVWTVIGPQIIEGVLTLYVVYTTVRRYAGPIAALLSAAALVTVPVSTALSRGNVPDTLSTLLLTVSIAVALKSLHRPGARDIILAGAWIGLAFQAKMLEAWLLIPVLAVVYLMASVPPVRTRVRNAALMSLAAVATSLSWMSLIALIPASRRPWFDGTHTNSIFEQVFIFNGLSRVTGDASLGLPARAASPKRVPAGHAVAHQVSTINVGPGWNRMFYGGLALGFSWLLPVAFTFGVLTLWLQRRAPRTDLLRAATVCWLLFLLGNIIALSRVQHVNSYYTAVLAPPLCALSGAGSVVAWRPPNGLTRWVAPATIGLSVVYAEVLLSVAGAHWAWLRMPIATLGSAAFTLSVVRAASAPLASRRLSAASAVTAFLTLVLAPASGSLAMDSHEGGPYTFAFSQNSVGPWPQPSTPGLAQRYRRPLQHLLGYVEPRTIGMRYLMGTGGAVPAATIMAATGRDVIPMGGYTGQMPVPTIGQVRYLIEHGLIRFFLIDPHSHNQRLAWIIARCQEIPGFGTSSEISPVKAQLFDCGPAAGT